MFLYRFVRRRRRRRRPHILVHKITFDQHFGYLSFLAPLLALTCRLHDYILVDFRRDLDLDFSRSNMEFAISQPKMVWLPRNEKQTYRLNSRAQIWPSDLTLAMTLALNIQGQIYNLLYLSQKWSDCHETNSNHIDWTLGPKCDHRVWPWPWPWPWIFKVKYRICYISAKKGPIATKRKANISIELQELKYDHQFWPWPWPWPWIFKVKYGISYISANSGPIAAKRKTNISIELQASNVTNGFYFDHNLDLWILKVKRDLDLWPHTWLDHGFVKVKFWNSCISDWEGQLILHKRGGSRSFRTMTMTIWCQGQVYGSTR